ncbi:MAG: sulfite exporter TauE/SafE family protein [Egibacteraceae bacterium]
MLVAVVLGVGVGGVLGVLGGGGSILAVPALVYGLHQPMAQAVPTSLLVVGVSAAAGAVPKLRTGDIRWAVAAVFGGAGIATAFAGSWLNHRLPETALLAGFAVLMGVVGVHMLRGAGPPTESRAHPLSSGRMFSVGAAGVVVGFLTGLFGVGGGFVIVPALVLILGLPMKAAIATSLVVIVVNSVAGLVAHLGQSTIDLATAASFTAGGVLAALAGSRLSRAADDRRLTRWFGVLVCGIAAAILLRLTMTDGPPIG